MRHFANATRTLLLLWTSPALALPLGTLVHDGPVTPEQISMYLPVTGALDTAASAAVRYRPSGGATWLVAHPPHRIRSAFSETPVPDAFAGVITGLVPGASYEVEVTVSLGIDADLKTLTVTTRALPPTSPAANKTIAAGSTSAQIQTAFDGLVAGDVLEFADGTYTVDGLALDRSGTAGQPITLRGASRSGAVIRDPTDRVLYLLDASYIVIEDLTLEGSGVDSGTASTSEGIRLWNGVEQKQVTVRRVTMRGVDKAVVGEANLEQILVYDCTFTGNNVWTQPFLESNLCWNDDGIRVPGHGNAVFNNTLSGFGDALAVTDGVENVAVHFYRNEIRMTCDDAFEGDYGVRNITFYDNRVHNSMTLVSFDPLRGGPAYVFRNIAINVGRSPYKFNNTNTGHFIYNNTVVRTNGYGSGAGWGWTQFNNGAQQAWGYRNNLLIYRGSGGLMAMEAGGQDPIDFTNNAWFPDGSVWWTNTGGSFSTMAQARAGLAPTTPVFGTSTQRHQNDVISEADPFVDDITLGSTYLTQVTTMYDPTLSPASAPKAAGVAIPGITDGFVGAAPDVGAVITGMAPPVRGDRGSQSPSLDIPSPPTNLRVQ